MFLFRGLRGKAAESAVLLPVVFSVRRSDSRARVFRKGFRSIQEGAHCHGVRATVPERREEVTRLPRPRLRGIFCFGFVCPSGSCSSRSGTEKGGTEGVAGPGSAKGGTAPSVRSAQAHRAEEAPGKLPQGRFDDGLFSAFFARKGGVRIVPGAACGRRAFSLRGGGRGPGSGEFLFRFCLSVWELFLTIRAGKEGTEGVAGPGSAKGYRSEAGNFPELKKGCRTSGASGSAEGG